MSSTYKIYGSSISLFTRKLEAAMEFYGAPFSIERKSDSNRENLEKRAGTHQIPVLETPEAWMLADTSPIIATLDGRFPHRRLIPTGPLGVLVAIVEEVLDEWVARTMVHYRWHYDKNTQAVASALAGRSLTIEQAREFPLAQWGRRACRATGTESVTQQVAAEREYEAILDALSKQLRLSAFALGDRPSAADTILIGSLRGHTNNDPLPDLGAYKSVLEWDKRAQSYAGPSGDWAAFPDSTPFANFILELARQCYKPFVLANARALQSGQKAFVIDTYGESVSYLARPYPERSRQMICERFRHQLDADEKKLVSRWLEEQELAECFTAPRS